MRTNEALFDILRDASVATGMPDGWCGLLTTREDVSVMLKMDEYIDLIIPARLERFCALHHGKQQHSGAGAQRRRVPRVCGCGLRRADGRAHRRGREDAVSGCLQCRRDAAGSQRTAGRRPARDCAGADGGRRDPTRGQPRPPALYAAGVASEAGDESDWGARVSGR